MTVYYKTSSTVYLTKFDDYLVEFIHDPTQHSVQSWLFNEHYGVKMIMIEMSDDVVFEFFYDMVMDQLPDYINFYKEKYEDEE